jgi:hypothetical protein
MEQNIDILNRITNSKKTYVKIVGNGGNIDLKEFSLTFNDKESVVLTDCNFTGGSVHPIKFDNCRKIVVKNCRFSNFKSRVMSVKKMSDVIIEGCTFKNCKYEAKQGPGVGGVIHSGDAGKTKMIDITNSSFESCVPGMYGNGIISDINSNVENCKFIKCGPNLKNYSPLNDCTLFPNKSTNTDCTFEKSVKFNQQWL